MLNTDKELKLYYSIGEVADMFGVNQSLLRFWEKEFPQISPRTIGRGIRQYRKEDVETIGLIYHLVKEKGMTLPGARQRLKDNKEATIRNYEIVNRLKAIKDELLAIKAELDQDRRIVFLPISTLLSKKYRAVVIRNCVAIAFLFIPSYALFNSWLCYNLSPGSRQKVCSLS